MNRLNRQEIAEKVAADIPKGAIVNLGIGMPTLIQNHLDPSKEVLLHSENGVIGMGPTPIQGEEDNELINAGKQYVTLIDGGTFFHHSDSFAMIRGGHIDFCILGAFQVSLNGDLANWHTGEADAIPAVGGAMDLAIGAKNVFIMTELFNKSGHCKLVEKCTYPVTGIECVNRIYTDIAMFEVTPNGLAVRNIYTKHSFDELKEMINIPIIYEPYTEA